MAVEVVVLEISSIDTTASGGIAAAKQPVTCLGFMNGLTDVQNKNSHRCLF